MGSSPRRACDSAEVSSRFQPRGTVHPQRGAVKGRQIARENRIQKTGGIDPADLAPLRLRGALPGWVVSRGLKSRAESSQLLRLRGRIPSETALILTPFGPVPFWLTLPCEIGNDAGFGSKPSLNRCTIQAESLCYATLHPPSALKITASLRQRVYHWRGGPSRITFAV
jgi:hypothetical protein